MHAQTHLSRIVELVCIGVTLALVGCGGGGGSGDNTTEVAALTVAATASAVAIIESNGPPSTEGAVGTDPVVALNADLGPVAALSATQSDESATATVSAVTQPTIHALASTNVPPPAPAAVNALDIFVATDGNDSWSGLVASANIGRTDGPVRTVAAAQLIARQRVSAMAGGATRQPINVRIASGEYRLSTPLTFGAADSGIVGAPVVYRAETAGTVTFSGAMRVGTAAGPAAGTMITLPAPAMDASNMRGGTQLYVNARRATLARSPNAGSYWFVKGALTLPDEPVDQPRQEAFVPPSEALTLMNGLSAAERSQAIVNIMQAWSAGSHRMSSLAAPAGALRVSPRTLWPFLSHGTDQRFFIENVAAALDAPGEFLWDASGLRYISTVADVGQALTFEMPLLDKLLVIKGNAATAAWVQDLEFRGLTFAHTRQITPDSGFTDHQAGSMVGAAVEIDAARRIVIDSCVINRTGGYGVWLRTSVRESKVSNCRMSDLGAGGVKVGLTAQSPNDVNGTGLNTVYANIISDTGKVIPGAVGVWVGQSSDNTVSNNLIANTSYSAISVGWKWIYGTPTASRNRIVNNLLLNIGLGQMSDIGAIYTLGESPGTVISGNVIHEVRAYPGYGAGAWGLYNDAASAGVLWERNVVVGTNDGGYVQNFGHDNTVHSNLLAFGDRREVRLGISDPLITKLDFNNNLLLPKSIMPFDFFATSPDVIYANNRVSNRVLSTPADLTKCGGGCTVSTVVLTVGADPRIITLTGADIATATWVAEVGAAVGPPGLAASVIPAVKANLPPAIVAPPVGFEAALAETAVGGRPFNLKYVTGGSATAIAVQADAGTPTGKSLIFTDSAAIVNRWEPYAWATLSHTGGISTVEFSIKIDANTHFMHEWRDNANSYLAGPSMRIKPTGIEVAGRIVASAPVGEWINLKITAPLDAAAGRWTLEVRYSSGAVATVSNLANINAGWKRLNWLGFVSNSGVASTAKIGFIKANTSLGG